MRKRVRKRVRIYQEECITDFNPRDNDNLGTMVCWHRNYSLGDKHQYVQPKDFQENTEGLEKIILPLNLYDHSGLSMSTSEFNDSWDSGQVGWIYVTYADLQRGFPNITAVSALKERGIQALEAEVEEYNLYLQGAVYGYEIQEGTKCKGCGHVSWEHADSCGGFIGWVDENSHILQELEAYDVPKYIRDTLVHSTIIGDWVEWVDEEDTEDDLAAAKEEENG